MSDASADPTPAERWFRLADEDLHAARVLLAEGSAVLRIAGFLAQQAAEKSLKAALLASAVNSPKIHGLRQLYGLLPTEPEPAVSEDDMDLLDPWVIDGRYAADLPDLGLTEAAQLLAAADRIVDSMRSIVDEYADASARSTTGTETEDD